jgi:hypothetical protein
MFTGTHSDRERERERGKDENRSVSDVKIALHCLGMNINSSVPHSKYSETSITWQSMLNF